MFSLKSKLDLTLRADLEEKSYKNFRVILLSKSLHQNIEKKITAMKGCSVIRSIEDLNMISAYLTPYAIERLIEYPEVKYITYDSLCFLCGNSVTSANRVRIHDRYKVSGKGICIGLIDSGVYPHTDLSNPNKIRTFVDVINNYTYPYDDNGHGTFISGILCGSGTSSKGMYRGIAEGSQICCYKAFQANGRGYTSDILFSIYSILQNSEEYNIKLLCLPFEVINPNKEILVLYSTLFNLAKDKNILVIAPTGSGESKDGYINSIGTLPNCLTVGGIDTCNSAINLYKFSPFNSKLKKPDLCAACSNITSLNTHGNFIPERNGLRLYPPKLETNYITFSGTSCACAYVTAICALVLERKPSLLPKDLVALLKTSSKVIDDIPKEIQGSGIIDVNMILTSDI